MAKGTIAKENVTKIIAKAFGSDYVGVYDKKLYVSADDGGEKVQIALSMTCPKVPIGEIAVGDSLNFDEEPMMAPVKFEPAEVTEEEQENIKELLKKLNL